MMFMLEASAKNTVWLEKLALCVRACVCFHILMLRGQRMYATGMSVFLQAIRGEHIPSGHFSLYLSGHKGDNVGIQ